MITMSPDFEDLFRAATGFAPYAYQRELARTGAPPAVVNVPTGAGKTYAALIPWLADPLAPRRLVYALPMRSLVEQTRDVVTKALSRLGDPTPVHVLMGGVGTTDWCKDIDQRAVLIGTIDMLVSAALNRGYGSSRMSWPVAFGLLNSDCRWIFDEVQLMGPARATSAQLHGLRTRLGTMLPCETMWMSATVDPNALCTVDHPLLGDVVGLTDADRTQLAGRLEAVKTVNRLDVGGKKGAALAKEIAEATLPRHEPRERTIVVVNRVDLAQEVHAAFMKALRKTPDAPEVVLLHSRFRPPDRAQTMARVIAEDLPSAGRIIVATQVIEAGVDLTSSLLVTETAPFSSIVQRLGRCNRDGKAGNASVLWIDRGELDAKASAPYHPDDLRTARDALTGLVGQSASPSVLESMRVDERPERSAVLRHRDLLDLFDTAPDLSGTDIDVAPYIRADDDRSVSVFFRDLPGPTADAAAAAQARPVRDELVQVPIGAVSDKAARAWIFDIHAARWARATPARRVPPGAVVMLDAGDGRYSAEVGWTGKAADVPDVLSVPEDLEKPEALSADPRSEGETRWMPLAEHLADVHAAAAGLAAALGVGAFTDSVTRAAALHDIGKAHPAFQQLLRTSAPEAERGGLDGELWAKSPHHGGRNPRRHFRHELLSALALGVQGPDGVIPEAPLVRYLVAAHHGRVRVSIRPAPEEVAPAGARDGARFALGVVDGDVVPAVQTPLGALAETTVSLDEMELGGAPSSWSNLALTLRDQHGPFVLAYLEAIVRVADWRASADV